MALNPMATGAEMEEPKHDEDQQEPTPTIEVNEDGHLDVGLTLEASSDAQFASTPVLVDEPEPDANDIRRDLEDLQKQLERGHKISHLQPPEPILATIADTATDVRQIREDLDELQERLAFAYPLSDEEKLACKLPWVPLESRANHTMESALASIPGLPTSRQVSLADACAVLRGAAQRATAEPFPAARANSQVIEFSAHNDTGACLAVRSLLPSELTLAPSRQPEESAAKATGDSDGLPRSATKACSAASCGDELRRATHVLTQRLSSRIATSR
jgi:hypothetical protein